jgi:glutamate-1-semialdehyde 2,1-aminomutase
VTENIIVENHQELAAVIVEPVLGAAGMIPPETGFLEMLRATADKYGILLIFDEVLTFRLSKGGCQGLYSIVPDLTALGKMIGGGFPVGALAGSNELLKHFVPETPGFFGHSGTFNGNPVTMTAGLATLGELTTAEIERINHLGKKMRVGLRQILDQLAISARVTGAGSLAQVHFTRSDVRDWRSAATANVELRTIFHLLLMENGIFTATRTFFNISTPMSQIEVSKLIDAARNALTQLRPFIEHLAPELLADG